MKAEWENLAKSYIRLAEQSEESDHIDVFYDPIIGILGGVAALNSKRHIPPQRTSATEKGEEAAGYQAAADHAYKRAVDSSYGSQGAASPPLHMTILPR